MRQGRDRLQRNPVVLPGAANILVLGRGLHRCLCGYSLTAYKAGISHVAHRAVESGFGFFVVYVVFSFWFKQRECTLWLLLWGIKEDKEVFLSHLLCCLPEALTLCPGGGLPGGCGHPMSLQVSWPLFPRPFGNLAGSTAYFLLWNFHRDGFVGWLLGAWGCWA